MFFLFYVADLAWLRCCSLCAFREIEGKEYVGVVKEKEKAKKQYEKAVSSGQTAGLVQWVDPDENE